MTNKEFFQKTLETEMPVFIKVIGALPKSKANFKPHKKARTADSLMNQLSEQPAWISGVITSGVVDFSKPLAKKQPAGTRAEKAEMNFEELKKNLNQISDADWENGKAEMSMGGKNPWETKKFTMAWTLLFDMIHHRGQLSTYVRAANGKVPAIYGGSADEPMKM
jgi:uncharacterized damage-inducible protein DinB